MRIPMAAAQPARLRAGSALAALLIAISGATAHAAGGPVGNQAPATAPVPPGTTGTPISPDTPAPSVSKPSVGTSDTATAGQGTPAPSAAAPGTDASTAAPGGQAESTKNGALGTTGENVPNRHHGPKKPTHRHDPADGAPPASSAPP